MKKFVIRLLINAVALYAAIFLINGIHPQTNNWLSLLWLALIFGAVNAALKPLLTVVGCPFIVLTLGLGALLINTLLFYLAGLIGQAFNIGFTVDGFMPAFLGSLVVSIVSFILNSIFKDELKEHYRD